MVKLIKWLVIVLVALVLLLVLGIIVVASVVDPNDYKPDIIDQVKKHTGRDLLIEGDLSWQLWPPIGISVGKTQLNNTPAFGGTAMLRLDQVVVDVQILPLLSNTVIVDEVSIDGFYFHRITNENGKTNLDDLLVGETATEPETVTQEKSSGTSLQDIRLGKGISITNALLIDENQATKTSQQLELISLNVGQFAFDSWFDVGFEVKAELSQPAVLATVKWQSQLQLNRAMDHIKLRNGLMQVNASGEALPKPLSLRLDTAVDINLTDQRLIAEPLQLKIDNLELTAPLTITSLTTMPEVATDIVIKPFDARKLLTASGVVLETADEEVLTRVGLNSKIGFNVEKSLLDVADFTISLNDTHISGSARVQTGEKLVSRFNIAVDALNLDRYLPPPSESKNTEDEKSVGDDKAAAPDIRFLRSMDVEGKVSIGQLQANQVELSNINLNLLIKQGKLQVKPLIADIYKGTIRTDLTLNANPDVPEFQLQQSINGVQVGPLLKAVADTDMLSGATEFKAGISGRSLDPVIIQKTLNGNGQFMFRDGAVKGINIAQLVRDAQAKIKGEYSSDKVNTREPKQTDFSELSGTFSIVNGLLNNPDLTAFSPLLRIRGNGDINLPEQKLDYRTKVSIVGSLKGQGGKSAGDLERLTIPLLISGPFAKPEIKLDLEGAMKDKATAKLKEEGRKLEDKAKAKLEEKAKEKLGDKAKDKIGEKLKGLLNKSKE
jgi:AsmA protein